MRNIDAFSKTIGSMETFNEMLSCGAKNLALGVPVVSTDCVSGPREILENGERPDGSAAADEMVDCGALSPVFPDGFGDGDILSEELLFAKAAADLLLDAERYESAREAALARSLDFSSQRILSRYESLCMKETI